MAQLAEAYVRLRPYHHVSEEQLARLGRATDEFARIGALEFYKQPVEITVELVQGTLWAKVKLAGRIFFVVFTGYASIDGAINTTEKLCKSANLFGDYVCSSFIKEAKAKPEQVERVERRLLVELLVELLLGSQQTIGGEHCCGFGTSVWKLMRLCSSTPTSTRIVR